MTESTERSGPEQQPERDEEFEARFAQLLKDVEEGRKAAFEEPSAQARMLGAQGLEQPPDRPRKSSSTGRVWPRNALIAVVVGALTAGAVEVKRHRGFHGAPTAAVASSAKGAPSATQGASASASASTSTSTSTSTDAVSQIPVSQLYPQTVKGAGGTVYTLVTAGPLNSCVDSDMVAPALEARFAQSKGCVGGEGALYKDAAKDQFNMTVFTLEDPGDVVDILTELSMDPTDFEVGVLAPPKGSGLAMLSATSGIIQEFTSSGHYMGVFMAQWSDGRAADYASLQKLLDPLRQAVSTTMNADR